MTDLGPERRPPRLSTGIAVAAAATVALSVLGVLPAVGLGVLGVLSVTVGLALTSRRLIEFSGAVLGTTVVVGGGLGVDPAFAGIGAIGAVVAWDVADHAHDLGQQIGRDARTRRNELAHVGGSLLVGGISGAVVYGIFLGMAGGQPTTALAFLLCGAIALVAAIR